jgi:acyl-CoA thioesterase-1
MVVGLVACGGDPPAARAGAESSAAMAARPENDAPPPPGAPTRRIVFLGDSLTAGLGLPADQSYPALIEQRLAARQHGWTVVNAGVSGDTSAGGLRRLEWSLDGGAAIVVVALGGNDALRGLPVTDLAKNLDTIVARATASGARVVVAGMEAPPNNGPDYTAAFRAVYDETARRHHATRIPFLLDGVAGIETLNQADGIHPNREGARLVADTVWRALEPVVRDLEATPTR